MLGADGIIIPAARHYAVVVYFFQSPIRNVFNGHRWFPKRDRQPNTTAQLTLQLSQV